MEWPGGGALAVSRGVVSRRLAKLYYAHMGKPAGTEAVQQAKLTLAALADATRAALAVRVARPEDGRILVDRADGQMVEVTAEGWSTSPLRPATFRRFDAQAPLMAADPDGTPDDLLRLLEHVRVKQADRLLLACWLVTALLPDIAHAILAPHGPKGATKSTLARLVRLLLDPPRDDLHAAPRDGTEFGLAAEKRWVLTPDNLSAVPPWLAALLCLTATGGVMARRKLYTDADETLFELRRVVVMTSVAQLVEREDLLDRLFLLRMEPVPEEERLTEAEWYALIRPALPRALGGLYSATSYVLRHVGTAPRPAKLPRLADWARYAALAAEAFGLSSATFFDAWGAVGRRQQGAAADASILPGVAATFLVRQPEQTWHGPAGELYALLTATAEQMQPPVDTKRKEWPGSPTWLSRRLDEQSAALAGHGIAVQRREHARGTLLTLTYTLPEGSDGSATSATERPSDARHVAETPVHRGATGSVNGATSGGDSATGATEARPDDALFTPDAAHNGASGSSGAIIRTSVGDIVELRI